MPPPLKPEAIVTAPSYVSGTSSQPLIGETIGENLRRTVERFPDREALVVPSASSS